MPLALMNAGPHARRLIITGQTGQIKKEKSHTNLWFSVLPSDIHSVLPHAT